MTSALLAQALARHRNCEFVDTIDLLGSCLLQEESLADDLRHAGFGSYEQLRQWIPEYPSRALLEQEVHQAEAPAPSAGRLIMRLIHLLLGKTIRSWARRILGSTPSSDPSNNFTPEAQAVWSLATELSIGEMTAADLLEALSVGPGTHRWYIGTDRRLLAAIARTNAGRVRLADRIVLTLDWPSKLIRRVAAMLWKPRQMSPLVVVGRALWSVAAFFWLTVKLVLGTAGWLAVAGLLLCSLPFVLVLRELVALATSTKIRTLNPLLRLGGSVEVTAPSTATRIAVAVLLPRLLGFLVGVAGTIPLTYALLTTGRRPVPNMMSRPELLARESGGFPEGPILLLIEATLVHGHLAGYFFLGMLGLLFLTLPTAREAELAWVHLRYGVGAKPFAGRLLWPLRMTSTLFESVERLFFWGVGPVYAAAGLVPIVLGLLLSSALARLFV